MPRRAQPIFAAVAEEVLPVGLALDRHPLNGPLWIELNNVEIRAGGLRRAKPRALLISPTTKPIRGMGQLETASGVKRLYFGVFDTLFGYNFVTTDTTGPFTGVQHQTLAQRATSWSFADWGDWMIATNGLDPIQVAKNSNAFEPLAGAPARAEVVLKSTVFLLAFNTPLGADMFQWCDANNPENWTVSTTTSAGNQRIRDLDGPIVAACPLGSEIAVYGEEQLFRVGAREAPFWFGVTRGPNGIGAVGKMAVCSDGRLNYGVSRQGIWMTDGFTYEYIDTLPGREMQRWLQDNVNWAQASKIVARRNELAGTIDFALPLGTSLEPNTVLRWHIRDKHWTQLTRAMSSADERRVTSSPVSATPGGHILLDEQGSAWAGDDAEARATTRPLMLGTPHVAAYIDEVQVLTRTPGTLQWRLGVQLNLDDPIDWTPWASALPNMETHHVRLEGTYFTFQVRSTSATDVWDFSGFLLYGAGDGLDRGRGV